MSDPSNRPFMEAIMRGQLPPELDPGDPSIQVGDGGRAAERRAGQGRAGRCAVEGLLLGWYGSRCHVNVEHLQLRAPVYRSSLSRPHPSDHLQVHVNLLRRDEDYTPPAQPRVRAFTGTGYKLTADDAGGAGPSTAAGPTTEVTPGAVTWEGADPAQPTTSIQLRLADGSRLRAEFNLSHTVADIRRCGRGLVCASLWPEACHCRQHQHAMLWPGLLLALVASFVIWLCAPPYAPSPVPQVHPRLPPRHRGPRVSLGHCFPCTAVGRRLCHH
jgi:hypothetical protein